MMVSDNARQFIERNIGFRTSGPEMPIQQFVEGVPPLIATQTFHQACEGFGVCHGFCSSRICETDRQNSKTNRGVVWALSTVGPYCESCGLEKTAGSHRFAEGVPEKVSVTEVVGSGGPEVCYARRTESIR